MYVFAKHMETYVNDVMTSPEEKLTFKMSEINEPLDGEIFVIKLGVGIYMKKKDALLDGYQWKNMGSVQHPRIKNVEALYRCTTYHSRSGPTSTSNLFSKMVWEKLRDGDRVVVFYKGTSSIAKKFAHGNKIRTGDATLDNIPFEASRSSTKTNISKLTNAGASVNSTYVQTCLTSDPPRNLKQVSNVRYLAARMEKISRDELDAVVTIMAALPGFVRDFKFNGNDFSVILSGELVQDVHCNFCEQKRAHLIVRKFEQPHPNVFIIRLVRPASSWLPLNEYLNFSPTDKFRLRSVLIARGSDANAHYITYGFAGNGCYRFDDMAVGLVDSLRDEVIEDLQKCAQIVIYCREEHPAGVVFGQHRQPSPVDTAGAGVELQYRAPLMREERAHNKRAKVVNSRKQKIRSINKGSFPTGQVDLDK